MTTPRETILTFIHDQIGFDGPVDPEADLIEDQILDSFNIIELALFVEQSFGIELQAEDVNRENFCRIVAIEALIEKRKQATV
jgi:acyl carrier protein